MATEKGEVMDGRSANLEPQKKSERQNVCRSFGEIDFPDPKSTTYCRGSQDNSYTSFSGLD